MGMTTGAHSASQGAMPAKLTIIREEIYILSGTAYCGTAKLWLKEGDYACRPPGMIHGPFSVPKDGEVGWQSLSEPVIVLELIGAAAQSATHQHVQLEAAGIGDVAEV